MLTVYFPINNHIASLLFSFRVPGNIRAVVFPWQNQPEMPIKQRKCDSAKMNDLKSVSKRPWHVLFT